MDPSSKNRLFFWLTSLAVIIVAVIVVIKVVPSGPGTQPDGLDVPKTDLTRGDSNALVTLDEYSDFQCPSCAYFSATVDRLYSEFGQHVKFSYHYFPLTNIHQNALASAYAAQAAFKQGKFWEMAEIIFKNQESWANETDPLPKFLVYAGDLGLDPKKFQDDYASSEVRDFVKADLKSAEKLGLTYTPSVILNGKLINKPGSYDDFRELIRDAIDASAATK